MVKEGNSKYLKTTPSRLWQGVNLYFQGFYDIIVYEIK